MRELDLLLAKCLASGLDSLEEGDLDLLEELLEAPDQDILAWLMGSAEPEDPGFRSIVNVLQSRIHSQSNSDE